MVSVDSSTSTLDPRQIARAHRAVELIHSHVYFAPETEQHLTAAGLRPGRMCYFAGRSAAMGAVGAGTVTATFYNFSPALVARTIPEAWELATPAQVLSARLDAARASLTRLLGDLASSDEVGELGELLREATTVLSPEGRALYAGHADLPWPEEPLLVLWHAATLLREHRGDGHVAALLHSGLSGIEALVTHTAMGRGFTPEAAKATRGWGEDEWAAAAKALADRGLVDDAGLTEEGVELRARLEVHTDALSADPWLFLGPERTARVVEIAKEFSRTLVANGALSASGLAKG